MIIDLRHERTPAPVRGKNKIKTVKGAPVIRRPQDIDSLVIHQTACDFGAAKGQPRYRRALDVACHALCFKTGETVLAAPFLWHVNHGNGFNPRSLGIEVEGHYPGIPGYPAPRGSGPGRDLFSPEHRIAFRECIEAVILEAEKEGIHIRYVYAHRQSSETRRADPGFEIWGETIEIARSFPLKMEPGLAIGTGRPIPYLWDPEAIAPY